MEDDADFVRGESHLARKDVDGAVLSFRKALANNPGNAAAHFELGLIFYEPSNNKKTTFRPATISSGILSCNRTPAAQTTSRASSRSAKRRSPRT